MVMTLKEYAAYDGLGLKTLQQKGDVSAVELAELARLAIQQLNPRLNFLVADADEDVRTALENIDLNDPFSGVPVLVKDGIGMTGQPESMSCRLYKGALSVADTECLRRLKKTGAVILGSTNAPELCGSFTTESLMNGLCRNPWHSDHIAGGSSGGAAAAVAAGVVPIAQGGDGAGSIRVPAHCCGVFGLMPSRGRTPSPGYGGSVLGVGRKHVLTRSVRDSAAMLDQLNGSAAGDLYQLPLPSRPFSEQLTPPQQPLKIAFNAQSPSGTTIDKACVEGVLVAANLAEQQGHQVTEVTHHYPWEAYHQAFYDYWAFLYFGGGTKIMEEQSGRRISLETLEPATLQLLDHYRQLTPDRIGQSLQALTAIGGQVGEFYQDYDILITPVCLSPAPKLGTLWQAEATTENAYSFERQLREFAPFTAISNTSGQPSMSVPLHQSEKGLPVGVLCTAKLGDEATLLRLAAQFETACPWSGRIPAKE